MRFIKRVLRNFAIALAVLPGALALCAGVVWMFDGFPEDLHKVTVLVTTLAVDLTIAIANAALQEAADRINKG